MVPAATRFEDAFDAEETALGAGGVAASVDEEGAGTAPDTGVAEGRSAALAPDSDAIGAELPSCETVDALGEHRLGRHEQRKSAYGGVDLPRAAAVFARTKSAST